MSDLPTGTRVRINNSYPCEFGRGAVGTVTPGLYNNSVLVRLDTPTEYAYESLYCSLSELDILEPEEPKPMTTADTVGALKSSIWDLYTEVANEFEFCDESRKLIERRLSQLGISAPKKRWRISFEVEGDSAYEAEAKVYWTSPSVHELPSFKVEEI